MPLISVIVPIYNVEKYLSRCVDSVLTQTFTDFELILVDDGSPDNCGTVCDEYEKKDSRVRVIHKKNGGLSDARNAGIDWVFEHSDSEWITFIDSDDWIHPRCLEALYGAVKETGLSLSVCGFERTKGEAPAVDEANLKPEIRNTEDYYKSRYINAVVAWGKLYRKEDFRTLRYPKGKIHEDEFTTYKVLFLYKEIAVVDQPLYAYFRNPDGITKTDWSPKTLVKVEALEERLDYLKERHQDALYDFTAGVLIGNLVEHYMVLSQSADEENKKHMAFIREHLQKALPLAKERDLFTQEQFDKLDKLAYPAGSENSGEEHTS